MGSCGCCEQVGREVSAEWLWLWACFWITHAISGWLQDNKNTQRSHTSVFHLLVIFNASLPDVLSRLLMSLLFCKWKLHRDPLSTSWLPDTVTQKTDRTMIWFAGVQHARPSPRADTCPFFLQSSCQVPSWATLQARAMERQLIYSEHASRAALSNSRKITSIWSLLSQELLSGKLQVFTGSSFIHPLWMWMLGCILQLLEVLRICWVSGSVTVYTLIPQQTQVKAQYSALPGWWSLNVRSSLPTESFHGCVAWPALQFLFAQEPVGRSVSTAVCSTPPRVNSLPTL